MCLYPHSNGCVLILGKCLGEVGCCTENRNAMSFVTSLNVVVVPNIAATEICFYSFPRTVLEKTVPIFCAKVLFWDKDVVQTYILDSYNHMSTLALNLNVSM